MQQVYKMKRDSKILFPDDKRVFVCLSCDKKIYGGAWEVEEHLKKTTHKRFRTENKKVYLNLGDEDEQRKKSY